MPEFVALTPAKARKLKAQTKNREKAWAIARKLVHEDNLKLRAKLWIDRVVTISERHLAVLESKKPEHFDLKDFEILTRITETVDRVARKSLGIDAEQGGGGGTNVTLHLAGELAPVQSRQIAGQNDEVIEVDCVPQQDSPTTDSAK